MKDVLAIDGGVPVRTAPFAPWPVFDDATTKAAADVIRSGRLTYWAGPHGRALERAYAASLGRAHAVAVANGTVALELGLLAFGIGTGDEVVVPARTFFATASSVVAVGATPVVADIDPDSGALTAESVSAVLSERTRAIIPVHLGGWPADMNAIVTLAQDHGLIVIEDCAQAHGATYHGRPAGALGSHAAAFSFCQDKIISSGEGGMLVLDDDAAHELAWSHKDHGKGIAALQAPPAPPAAGTGFSWLIERFGTNWRLSETAAVLVAAGLERLPGWVAQRRALANRLIDGLDGTPGLRVPRPGPGIEPSFYRVYAFVEADGLAPGWDRDRVATAIAAEGVPVAYGSCAEIYRERAFRDAGLGPAQRLPNAAAAHEGSLAFVVHPTLGATDIDDVVTAVKRVLQAAAR